MDGGSNREPPLGERGATARAAPRTEPGADIGADTEAETGRETTQADAGKPILGMVIWLVAYLVACAVFVWLRDRSIFLSILAIFAIAGAAVSLHATVRQVIDVQQPLGRRVLWVSVVPAVGAILLVVWWFGVAEGAGFFGLALLYLGLGLVVEQLRSTRGLAEHWGIWVLGGCAVVSLVGVACMAIFGATWTTLVFAAGVLAAPIGLSLVSGKSNRILKQGDGPPLWVLVVVGAVLFVGGLALVAAFGVDITYVALLGGVVFLLMLAIAARSNADVVLFIALAAVIWTLTNRTVPLTASVTVGNGDHVLVALGDSYISGEGADAFFQGTNTKGANECRRAPTAYPALLVLDNRPDVPRNLAFLACSGAKTPDVRDQLQQLADLHQKVDFKVDLVLLSVGGNDALFGSVGQTCIFPGDCGQLGNAWIDNLGSVSTKLDGLYTDVRKAVGESVPVLVVPYPIPLAPHSCSYSALSNDEHRFLFNFTASLDDVVARSATKAGFYVVDTMPTALDGKRLCDGREGDADVNFLAANSVLGTLEQTVNPLNWVHNSLHPNARGHELMRTAVETWLDRHPNLTPVAPADGPQTVAPARVAVTLGSTCDGKSGSTLEGCTGTWRREESGRLLLTKGLIGLVVAFGAWVLVLPLIRGWRIIFPSAGQ